MYVISDLHLGGESASGGRGSFQMNDHPEHLASFVDWVRGKQRSELVINGDFVDFLAERDRRPRQPARPWRPYTEEPMEACDKLQDIVGRAPDVFEALKAFVADGHRLTVTLGNHDLELCIPAVEACLRGLLLGDRGKPEHLNLLLDGRAYSLEDARVVIEHGNFYDPWNTTPLDQVALVRWAHTRGMIDQSLSPPPGSELVAYVMNDLKRSHRFVDLLHPDLELVVPVLLVLRPDLIWELARHAKLLHAWARKSFTVALRPGLPAHKLVGGSEGEDDDATVVLTAFPRALGHLPDEFVEELLDELRSQRPSEGLVAGVEDERSGLGSSLTPKQLDRLAHVVKRGARACKALFALDVEAIDDVRAGVEAMRDCGAKQVLLGHTHYAKVREGYINTGTWASVLGIPAWVDDLDDTTCRRFAQSFFDYIRANDFSHPHLFRPTYARLTPGSEKEAELLCYGGRGKEELPPPDGAPWPDDVIGLRARDYGPSVSSG